MRPIAPVLTAALLATTTAAALAQAPAPTQAPAPAPVAPPAPAAAPPAPATVAPAPAAAASMPVTLRYKFTPGEVLAYDTVMTMKGSVQVGAHSIPMQENMTVHSTQMVKSVDASGDATLVSHTSAPQITLTVNGRTQTLPAAVTAQAARDSTVVVSPVGKLISAKLGSGAAGSGAGAGAAGMSNPMMQMFSGNGFGGYSFLPSQPVSTGDVWRGAITLPQAGIHMYTKSTLDGVQTTDGKSVADIGQKLHGDFDPNMAATRGVKIDGQIDGTGHNYFDTQSGTLQSSQLTMTMNILTKLNPAVSPAAAAQGPSKLHFDMTVDMHRASS